jgi:hypothetical protein
MLPEHVYKQKFYKVTLIGDKAGQDIEGLELLFKKSKYYPLALRDNWRDCIGKALSVAEWQELSEETYLAFVIELDSLGAMVEVIEFEKFEVFKVQGLSRYYSKVLLRMEEYAFDLWAKAENIEEAYRLTILPFFRNSQVVRIYRKDEFSYFVFKQGPELYSRRTKFNKQSSHLLLEASHWEKLAAFMGEHFWTVKTWDSHYGDIGQIRDGESFLFEGWKNGQYKHLSDHSPKDGSVSEQAFQLFRAIKMHTVGESLGHQSKFLPPIP